MKAWELEEAVGVGLEVIGREIFTSLKDAAIAAAMSGSLSSSANLEGLGAEYVKFE